MRFRILTAAALAAPGLGAPSAGQSGTASVKLSDFAGMWEARPPRGPGGPVGPGARRGRPPGDLGQAGPSPGQSFSPPLDEDDGAEFGGPNIPGLDRGDRMTYRIMTPAGQAAFEAMDPRKLPANNCVTNGLPSMAGMPDLQEWKVEGNRLLIHYGEYSTHRTVWLDDSHEDEPPSHLGHARGVFANRMLTITTTRLTASLGGLGRNAPGSASRTFIERYWLSPDGQSIQGAMTVHDPEYLTRDLQLPLSLTKASEVTELPDIECSVENSQLYLNKPNSAGR